MRVAACAHLASVLAERRREWHATFRPYDVRGTGVVGVGDLLRVFRDVGIAPAPDVLRALPPDVCRGPSLVDYVALRARVAGDAEPAAAPLLLSATSNAPSTLRPPMRR